MLPVAEAMRSQCSHQTSTVMTRQMCRYYISDFRVLIIKTQFYYIVVNPQLCDSGGCTHFISCCSLTHVITQERLKAFFFNQPEVGVSTPVPSCDTHDGTVFILHELNATFITVSSRQYYSVFYSYASIQSGFGWWISVTTTILEWAQ